jgi:peptidoglycan-associated lipoprotein
MNTKKLVALIAPCALIAACSTQPATESAGTNVQPAPGASAQQPGVRSASPQTAASGDAMRDAKGAKVAKRSVYYEFDKSDIKPEQLPTVEANARYLREQQALKVRVEGNADERGSREYNLALGQKRAESVAKTMRLLGVPESRMESVSYGAERPRASGHDEQSWSENRRADIVYP